MNKNLLFTFIFTFLLFSNTSSFAQWNALPELQANTGELQGLATFTENRTSNTLYTTESIAYSIGALGAVAMGVMCMMGRFQWSWFFAVIGGLFLVAGAATALTTLTGTTI